MLEGLSVFGGKTPDKDMKLRHDPVIFIHGNNAIGVGSITHGKADIDTGFSENVQYFLKNGYTKAELYVVTWGVPERPKRMKTTHD